MAERDEHGKWLSGTGSPNPTGRKPLPEDLKQVIYQEREWTLRKFHEFKHLTIQEIQAKQKAPETSSMELALLSTYVKAINGNMTALQIIMGYAAGKPVEKMEFSGPDGAPIAYSQSGLDYIKDDESADAVALLLAKGSDSTLK